MPCLSATPRLQLACRPRLRCRAVLLSALRVLLLLSPSIRQTGVGTSLMLERQPQPGLGGVLRQVYTIAVGAPLPPAGLALNAPPRLR